MYSRFKLSDFDFTGKRVRFNGICLTKFDLCLLLDSLKPSMSWFISYDFYTYDELVYYLKKYLNEVHKN